MQDYKRLVAHKSAELEEAKQETDRLTQIEKAREQGNGQSLFQNTDPAVRVAHMTTKKQQKLEGHSKVQSRKIIELGKTLDELLVSY